MEPAKDTLHKIVTDALKRAPEHEGPVLAWPMVCGPQVAEKTRALDFTAGILRVEVPDIGWRNQLMGFLPQYLGQLRQVFGGKVQRIHFVLPGERP